MAETLSDQDLRKIFDGSFLDYRHQPWAVEWRKKYAAHVELVQNADQAKWLDPVFQKMLWDENPVSNIGPGTSVTVASVYEDKAIAARLFEIRSMLAGKDLPSRGKILQEAFDEILGRVYPIHAKRRPKARLVRLLASMFPKDMTCLMDATRVWGVHRLIGAPLLLGDFVAQHAALKQRIREAVGESKDIGMEVDQSVFAWFLWTTHVNQQDEGAVTIEVEQKEANDLPPLSLLPANAQRRSLACVKDNVSLLVAVVREAEQGISREDLINTILTEAVQLNASSAANIISQATGGLGLIHLENGAFRPTQRGLELLTANDPAQVLRAPLIGRVFGMGHLLRYLSKNPAGVAPTAAARWLQTLVPSWTTTMPGSHIIAWSKLTGLVRSDIVGGIQKLLLTDDGQDYVSALPAKFEDQWTIKPTLIDPELDATSATVSAPEGQGGEQYNIGSIVSEGCFLAQPLIANALALLKRKKNLILQGPPGTGKTWLAKRLGYALIGSKDASRLMAVQFQPSLSYEDFVRGWRPDGAGGLHLADGAFLEALAAAKAEPERPFVLVIEEINRGNPAQILGELLTLLEADKRNEHEGLRLAYPRSVTERVYVPANLFVVGTMNLADRSLALVDLALRRRFAFVTLTPSLGESWRAWCLACGIPLDLIQKIEQAMRALNLEIASDRLLGPQFQIGHSFVTPTGDFEKESPDRWKRWFSDVIETEIAPLLAEYWYDQPQRADEQTKKLSTAFPV